jgi:hypothetical protein
MIGRIIDARLHPHPTLNPRKKPPKKLPKNLHPPHVPINLPNIVPNPPKFMMKSRHQLLSLKKPLNKILPHILHTNRNVPRDEILASAVLYRLGLEVVADGEVGSVDLLAADP